jgi:hypothetical protein
MKCENLINDLLNQTRNLQYHEWGQKMINEMDKQVWNRAESRLTLQVGTQLSDRVWIEVGDQVRSNL